MTRPAIRRALTGLLGVSLLMGIGVLPRAEQTEAAWTDAEQATATASAVTVPKPTPWGSPECTAFNVVVVGGRTTIKWRVPEGFSGYTSSDIEYGAVTEGTLGLNPILASLLGTQSTTGTPSAYTTTISGGLLSNALGGSMRFGMRLKGPGGWVSPWLVADVTFPALLGQGTCVLSTLPSYS